MDRVAMIPMRAAGFSPRGPSRPYAKKRHPADRRWLVRHLRIRAG